VELGRHRLKDTFGVLLGQLPDLPTDFNDVSPGFYIALMALGFLVGTFGHLIQSKTAIAAGLMMIFAATILLPFGLAVSR
jgi:hypothetical protein